MRVSAYAHCVRITISVCWNFDSLINVIDDYLKWDLMLRALATPPRCLKAVWAGR